jgi:hypothetical protein
VRDSVAQFLHSDNVFISGYNVDSPDSDVAQQLGLTGGQGPWQTEDLEKWTDEMLGKMEQNTHIMMPGCWE